MTLIKTSLLSLVATIVKMLSGLVINKMVATFIGPNGLALIGQFQNFIQLAMTIGQGGINTGVTKYTSEYGKESSELPKLFNTALKISIVSSLLVGLTISFFSNVLSLYLFDSDEYQYVFVIFGLTIVLFVFNSLMLSILNGLKEISTFIKVNITQSIMSLMFTVVLVYYFAIDGVLIALATNQSVIFLYLLWCVRKNRVLTHSLFVNEFCSKKAKALSKYALMAASTAILLPLSHMLIRRYISDNLGWQQAGYWQAIWYISTMYLMVVTTALSTYYLPRLSEISDKFELKKEIINGYKVILPFVASSAFAIYLSRDLVIALLFSEEFSQMRELFLWQLAGDVIKIAAWLLSYLMLAKAMTKKYIFTEIFSIASFLVLSIMLINNYGLIGITYAYFINYVIYFFLVFLLLKRNVL